ncbi:acetate--CoA ligase [Achromobacter denitrificans]|jgi:acetyl-CoA synthetase|uniref:acetate--CoA ligase n=1 Tax=Achromobacter denitrificans TaxID=32002 RepID=UPI000B0077A6|nr:acetate--CoA ligase [Achromobacter denitrificans]MDX3880629.1 acetate--CoA ligase [Achromobacter sp.]MBV2157101.1 acetate--CoA ligase [Achromobacter denitrificans]MDF3852290.1 acetate--CoA ligase [Achromobacter denitrificans]MDF3856724.1 acetate--CoA ligase [Achromobacter denitrificans]MPT38655.1 acetate--CoA ligase [Achromobacter sp.]
MNPIRDLYPVPEGFAGPHTVTQEQYEAQYAASLSDPDAFWAKAARRLHWYREPRQVRDVSFAADDFHIRWYADGELNVSVNCLDRHLETRGHKPALIWESDDPEIPSRRVSYLELHSQVCKLGNALRRAGIGRGDRVTLYMPMIVEAVAAMLACARIGAVHNVVFGGFAPASIADRVRDCGAKAIITADEGRRAGRSIALKANVDAALQMPGMESVRTVLVAKNTGTPVDMTPGRDYWLTPLMERESAECEPERMNAEDPLFILYTSGSTGKPKGMLHTTGGYLVYAAYTHATIFDIREDDVFWCTADVGWVTGHSYLAYGPLANGATSLVFEGVPSYPDASRFWQVVDKHRVSIFYTAPTAIRALMREGTEPVLRTARSSLRLLGSVGEPINPEAWRWYHDVVGAGRCPIVDTWWQTETGGILISPLPGAKACKPGAASTPFYGIRPELVDVKTGALIEGAGEGNLYIRESWPGQARSIYGDEQRYFDSCFKEYPGMYFTGDRCRRDADGDYWITGRVDDVLNVSGHRIGTAEVESALVSHPKVAEAAAVGFAHDIKGQGIYVYVTLKAGTQESETLRQELVAHVRREIGPIATPDHLQWAPGLPKTRSGKIMRRILRKIADNTVDDLGDITTLADPSVVGTLVRERRMA